MKKMMLVLVMALAFASSLFAKNPFRENAEEVQISETQKAIYYPSIMAAKWDCEKWLVESFDDIYPKNIYNFFKEAEDACLNKALKGDVISKTGELGNFYNLSESGIKAICTVESCEYGYYVMVFIYYKAGWTTYCTFLNK